ncbi:MAG: alpha/beta hydrolase [Ruminococcus sp.]|nr:alpha/beta hydrolase [Ruminococcus sp.]
MNKGLIYIHGKGGTAKEAEHYKILFPEYDVSGLDYEAKTPWEAQEEFHRFFDLFRSEHDDISIVANSIGAFFAMNALSDRKIEKAYFISPIVDMEKLIIEMMNQEHISEKELFEKGIIETEYGETLSWEYLLWIRQNPVTWTIPTCILYGEKDNLQSIDTIKSFADRIGAGITIMENGEHWFHTEKQMKFLDNWLHDVS